MSGNFTVIENIEKYSQIFNRIENGESRWFYTDEEGNDHEIQSTFTEWKQLRTLIAVARCPDENCVDGAIPVQVGEDEFEAQQCQWCYERAGILYGYD
jgi:hypothetical protein